MTALLTVAFLAAATWMAMPLDRFVDALVGDTAALTALRARPSLCALGVVTAAVTSWRGRWWSTAARLHHALAALGAVAFLAVAWEYQFLAVAPG